MTSDPTRGAASERELQITRVISAPRELVFDAFVDPDQVAGWWAPQGLEVPRETVEIEARAGGRIHFTMVDSRGGAEYPVRFEIVEYSEPELLALASPAMPDVGILEPTLTRVVLSQSTEGASSSGNWPALASPVFSPAGAQ